MLAAIDTNVLAYAEGAGDAPRRALALALIQRLPEETVLLPVQVLGELHRVLTGKLGRSAEQAREAVMHWSDAFAVREPGWSGRPAAFAPAAAHRVAIWASLTLSVAAEARCRVLLSEDLQPGFTWRGTTVVNPFGSPEHPLLEALLEHRRRR